MTTFRARFRIRRAVGSGVSAALLCLFGTSCLFGSSDFGSSSSASTAATGPAVSNVSVANDLLTIQGSGLDSVDAVQITGSGTFSITSQSATQLVAAPATSIQFTIGSAYSLVLTSADGTSASVSITFKLADGSVTPSILDRAYVQASGDSMFGALSLPAGGLTVGTNQLIVAPTGQVGIGTASPQSQLSLTQGMNIDQANANSGSCASGVTSCLRFGSGSGEAIASKRTSGGNQYGLDFYTAFANTMQLSQQGNLSLNLASTAPVDSGIQVNGSGKDMGLKLINSGTSGSSWYLDSTSSGSGYGAGSLAFTLAYGTPTLLLKGGNPGSVGIGTNSPAARLDVNGMMRLKVQPQGTTPSCGASTAGSLTITYQYIGCVCNGTSWVKYADNSTGCTF